MGLPFNEESITYIGGEDEAVDLTEQEGSNNGEEDSDEFEAEDESTYPEIVVDDLEIDDVEIDDEGVDEPGEEIVNNDDTYAYCIESPEYATFIKTTRSQLTNYDPTYLESLYNQGCIFYAKYDDDTEELVSWISISEPNLSTTETLSLDADFIGAASNQYFWTDTNGVHITDQQQTDWMSEYNKTEPTVHGSLAQPTDLDPWYNILINSLGIILRRGLLNLTAISKNAIFFYDGLGNNSSNIMAFFGNNSAQIGKTSNQHVIIDSQGLTVYNSDGSLALVNSINLNSVRDAAASANTILGEMRTAATQANTTLTDIYASAVQANQYSTSALNQLGVLEDVVGTLDWLQEHTTFTLTSDTTIQNGTVYYTLDQQTGDYTPVLNPNPNTNPSTSGWYVVNTKETQRDYLMKHLAVTSRGLWILPSGLGSSTTPVSGETQQDSDARQGNSYKVLVTNSGMEVYDETGTAVSLYSGSGTVVGKASGIHSSMSNSGYLISDGNDDEAFSIEGFTQEEVLEWRPVLTSNGVQLTSIPASYTQVQVMRQAMGALSIADPLLTEAIVFCLEKNGVIYPDSITDYELADLSNNNGQYLSSITLPPGGGSNGVQVGESYNVVYGFKKTVWTMQPTVTVGSKTGNRTVIDFCGLKTIDKENNVYLEARDLRDENGELEVVKEFYGDGFTLEFYFELTAKNTDYEVTVSVGSGYTISKSINSVTIDPSPPIGATITVNYITEDIRAKSYTAGIRLSNSKSGPMSWSEGLNNSSSSIASHAEGMQVIASGSYSHAEGNSTTASGNYSHAEGRSTMASGYTAHAEGNHTSASGLEAHAEGSDTVASGEMSHAEGWGNQAIGRTSHAEGYSTDASGYTAHAEGKSTRASGNYSHAEGDTTTASGDCSHAQGRSTKAQYADQTAIGRFNTNSSGNLFEIGNGTSDSARSNALEVSDTGDLTIGGTINLSAIPSLPVSKIGSGTLSRDKGGTGTTGMTTSAVTRSGVSTAGNFYAYNNGVGVTIGADSLRLKSALANGANVALGTVPDGCKPPRDMYTYMATSNATFAGKCMVRIVSNGTITLYNASGSSLDTSVNINFTLKFDI